MSIETDLQERSDNKCELCASIDGLSVFDVSHSPESSVNGSAYLCPVCQDQIVNPASVEAAHWQCLSDSMWSEEPAVKVLAWRLLRVMRQESWAQDLLDMMYLDEDDMAWAEAGEVAADEVGDTKHVDSNGAVLAAGDTVVLIKDLTVKGAGFTAKRGTAVRGISLVSDNAEHIEGRVSGQQIVILTKFVKKSN